MTGHRKGRGVWTDRINIPKHGEPVLSTAEHLITAQTTKEWRVKVRIALPDSWWTRLGD